MSNATAAGSAYRRADRAGKREIRHLMANEHARAAIGDLYAGCEIFGLTKGQFSLINLVIRMLEQTGPADVTIATWTAARAEIKHTEQLLRNGNIRTLRFLVDRSFPTRKPEWCATLRATFGDDAIRVTRTHCKFVLIRNATWNLVVRTSMNLNENPRIENFEISDDASMADYLDGLVAELFEDGLHLGDQWREEAFEKVGRDPGVEPKPMDQDVTDWDMGTHRLQRPTPDVAEDVADLMHDSERDLVNTMGKA